MNEFKEHRDEIPKIQEFAPPLEYQNSRFDDLIKEANTFVSETNDFIKGLASDTKEAINAREYGLRECGDAAKMIFTPEVLAEWGKTSLEQRDSIVQEYSRAIGDGLKIDFKGIVFEQMKKEVAGYNSGDGYVHLNNELLKDPGKVITLIDTVAHEARHQFQFEAIRNPERFGIDRETIKEWTAGLENYSTQYATEYDPWGYHYNPVELDARYFGESMVRELTKHLINNPMVVASLQQKNGAVAFSGSAGYHEGWAKSKARDAVRHSEQIARERSVIWQDNERGRAKDDAKAAMAEQKKADAAKDAAKKKGK